MPPAPPALAVVLVAFRSADALPATLDAVRAQLRPGDELVVVDNASPDDSAAVAARHGARVVAAGRNAGFAAGCHLGADATAAPLLLFLNPDAVPAPGCLDALRAVAAAEPGWAAWQALVTLPGGTAVNTAGGVVHPTGIAWAGGHDTPVARVPPGRREVGFASGAALCVRRADWAAAGGFDPAYFMYHEDVDLSVRLRLAGRGVGIEPAARVAHDYAFGKGADKWRRLEVNRWRTLLRDWPGPLLLAWAPALLLLELLLLPAAARGGWLRAKLAAHAEVARALPGLLHERRRVQAGRRVAAGAFAAGLEPRPDSPFLGAAGRSPLAARGLATYHRAVQRMLRNG